MRFPIIILCDLWNRCEQQCDNKLIWIYPNWFSTETNMYLTTCKCNEKLISGSLSLSLSNSNLWPWTVSYLCLHNTNCISVIVESNIVVIGCSDCIRSHLSYRRANRTHLLPMSHSLGLDCFVSSTRNFILAFGEIASNQSESDSNPTTDFVATIAATWLMHYANSHRSKAIATCSLARAS